MLFSNADRTFQDGNTGQRGYGAEGGCDTQAWRFCCRGCSGNDTCNRLDKLALNTILKTNLRRLMGLEDTFHILPVKDNTINKGKTFT